MTFTADEVQYDRDNNLVIARGHVEVWQAGRIVCARIKMSFNRQTGVVVAIGDVVMMQPDGQVMFAHYAELSRDMNDGILKDRARMLAKTASWRQTACGGPAGDERVVARGLFRLQPLQEGSRPGRRCGRSGPRRRCRIRNTRRSSIATPRC